MSTREIDLAIIEEWRELGFYYLLDSSLKRWLIRGDRQGLAKWAEALRAYSQDARNEMMCEHEHYGPYFYLKVMTWDAPLITEKGWWGTLDDINRLADMIDENLADKSKTRFEISSEYSPKADYVIHFEVEPDGWDPSSADPGIAHRQ